MVDSTVSVVEALVNTAMTAHQDSTGNCAANRRSLTDLSAVTSDSTRAKLCTKAMLPSASVARSARSEWCVCTVRCKVSVLRRTKAVRTANTTHSTMSRIASRQLIASASGTRMTSEAKAAKYSRKNPSQNAHSASVPCSIDFISRPEWTSP